MVLGHQMLSGFPTPLHPTLTSIALVEQLQSHYNSEGKQLSAQSKVKANIG